MSDWRSEPGGALGSLAAAPDPVVASRTAALAAFLGSCGWGGRPPVPLAADASFRSYYRARRGRRRAVVMDAPPPQEDVAAFAAVSRVLRNLGLSAPRVLGEDRVRGFLLLEDFGDDTYARLLAGGADEHALYALAVDALVALQRAVAAGALPDLPPYDEALLLAEAVLLVDWYLPAVLGAPLDGRLREEYLALWRPLLAQALAPFEPTLVLRDFHVDNLLFLRRRAGVRRCGLLDFQDAVCGPPSYDLVSLHGGCQARRSRAAGRGDDRALPRRVPAIRPFGLSRFRRGIRRPAQLQDHRHFYPALAARPQARLFDPYSAAVATGRARALPAGPGADQAVARPASAVRRPTRAGFAVRRVTAVPRSAMVLAAGLGTRLRPVTETLPKPLVRVNGRTLLDHVVDRLMLAGVERVVVNTHYQAAMVAEQLARRDRPQIEISHEAELLDTGGGVAHALPLLDDAFFVVNADVFWLEGSGAGLLRLARAFDPARMDAMLLLQPTATAVGYEGDGDYFLAPTGQPRRRREARSRRSCSPASNCCIAACSTRCRSGSFR